MCLILDKNCAAFCVYNWPLKIDICKNKKQRGSAGQFTDMLQMWHFSVACCTMKFNDFNFHKSQFMISRAFCIVMQLHKILKSFFLFHFLTKIYNKFLCPLPPITNYFIKICNCLAKIVCSRLIWIHIWITLHKCAYNIENASEKKWQHTNDLRNIVAWLFLIADWSERFL